MGISFKVSKTGRRFRPKLLQSESRGEEDGIVVNDSSENRRIRGKIESASAFTRKQAEISQGDEDATGFCDGEVSFTLSLYPDGYTLGKPFEGESGHQNSIEVPKFLHPYDRASETLFSAIESGRLPGDILDDIHCKYINGMLFCEVRDYRKCFSEAGGNMPSIDGSPIINKVCLRMSLENVVKDIPLISDNGWTYGDLMEVESRILKALQPKLSLDPTPMLDRLQDSPIPKKLNFALYTTHRKRFRQVSDVTVTSGNNIHGKKVCVDRVTESSRLADSGSMFQQSAVESLPSQTNGPTSIVMQKANSFGSNVSGPSSPLMAHPSKYPMGVGSPRIVQDHRSGSVLNTQGASLGQDMMIAYSENVNSGTLPFHGKRDSQEAQSYSLSVPNKRSRVTTMGVDGNQQQQHVGSQVEGFHGPDSYLKNTLLQQPSLARGIQYNNAGMQKYPQQMFDGSLHQESGPIPFNQGVRYGLKEEPVDSERLDKPELGRNKNDMHMLESELNNMDSQQSRLQQRIPQQLMRSSFPQSPWNGQGQLLESNSRKEDPYQKRKLVQSPRVSTGGLPQSPLSSKSGEFSSGSVGQQVGAAVTSGFVSSQKDRSVVTSVPPIGGATSLTSSANDSMQRQHQAQLAAKRRSNSLPKAPAMNAVGSPASVSNTSVPLNVSSPPVGTPFADPSILERFSKIEMVTARHRLYRKKNKVDDLAMVKPCVYQTQELQGHLSTDSSNEIFKDDMNKFPLSKSLVGGSTNICKTRVLNFIQSEHIIQGNNFSFVPKAQTRLIMSMKSNDSTVAMHIGEIEDAQYLAVEDYLPTLPNTHIADLLATQFCSLMGNEGYIVEDHVQPKPVPMIHASNGQPNTPGVPSRNASTEMQQYSEGVTGQQSNDIVKPSNSSGASLNPSNNLQGTRMLPPGNAQGLPISQGLLSGVSLPSRSQQSDTLPTSMQQQQHQLQNQQPLMQQQHPHLQRSSLMIAANQMPHLNSLGQNPNMQLGNQMSNKPSPIQLQLLQHQQLQPQQQQQMQMRRKMMMSLGNVGMGNIPNNMVLGNVMGMTGGRVSGGAGISAPVASIGGIGNMSQNPINMNQTSNISNAISQQLRSGLTPAHLMAATKLRMPHNRANVMGNPQSSISSMSGARPMHPGSADLSMLGTTLNRGNMNPMQRNIGQMAPPKLMTGMNMYMNQQQQQQPQQQQLLLQQLQQQQQQHETTSPLQAVVPPQSVGSPSNVGIQQPINQQMQQQASPQQMNQRTPMSPQLSSGAMHAISTGNPEACPASPQLSSQTLGSANSIANSPMELQGVNKNNSVNNA